jgi:hypothetical protein
MSSHGTTNTPDISVVLLHADQHDKQGKIVTTSLTMIDVHDIARSSRTFGIHTFFVAHPSPLLRKLARTLRSHWQEGFGATYNPNRKDALGTTAIVSGLEEAIAAIDRRTGKLPKLVATSAKREPNRLSCQAFREELWQSSDPYLLMFGTGWGMSDELIARAHCFLEPICGPGDYNHLSVRAAAGILLDRLMGQRS